MAATSLPARERGWKFFILEKDDILFDTIKNDLPPLIEALANIIHKKNSEKGMFPFAVLNLVPRFFLSVDSDRGP